MSNLPTTAKEKSQNLMMVLQARKDAFRELLPKYLTPEKLFRVAQLAMSKNPALLACTPASFVVAMMDSARCGLEPNGQDAALIPYGTECQFQPMWRGLVKQAINAGAAKKIMARLVFANDRFKIWYDPEPHINHEPANEDEGEIVGAYAYAILPDDSLQIEYMNRRQLDHIRAKSRSRGGPWSTDPEEMYRKTPTKRLFKYLPVSDEVEYAVQVDNMVESGGQRNDIPILDKAPEDLKVPQSEGIKEKIRRTRTAKEPEEPAQEAAETPPINGPVRGITESQVDIIEALMASKGIPNIEVCRDAGVSAISEMDYMTAEKAMAKLRAIEAIQ
jgi:recombination protein RecT